MNEMGSVLFCQLGWQPGGQFSRAGCIVFAVAVAGGL